MSRKQYTNSEYYEEKLSKVMARLGIERYDYDFSRKKSWVSFSYKGQQYRFEHSVENAKAHGVDLVYGSDAFAQLVLSLEDLARMVERGIYDLSAWVVGMKYLPPAEANLESCFQVLGFAEVPCDVESVRRRYRQLCKVFHPDSGGNGLEFQQLHDAYTECISRMGGN